MAERAASSTTRWALVIDAMASARGVASGISSATGHFVVVRAVGLGRATTITRSGASDASAARPGTDHSMSTPSLRQMRSASADRTLRDTDGRLVETVSSTLSGIARALGEPAVGLLLPIVTRTITTDVHVAAVRRRTDHPNTNDIVAKHYRHVESVSLM